MLTVVIMHGGVGAGRQRQASHVARLRRARAAAACSVGAWLWSPTAQHSVARHCARRNACCPAPPSSALCGHCSSTKPCEAIRATHPHGAPCPRPRRADVELARPRRPLPDAAGGGRLRLDHIQLSQLRRQGSGQAREGGALLVCGAHILHTLLAHPGAVAAQPAARGWEATVFTAGQLRPCSSEAAPAAAPCCAYRQRVEPRAERAADRADDAVGVVQLAGGRLIAVLACAQGARPRLLWARGAPGSAHVRSRPLPHSSPRRPYAPCRANSLKKSVRTEMGLEQSLEWVRWTPAGSERGREV